MDNVKIVVCCMVENEGIRIKLMLESILNFADKIVIVYSPSKDNTLEEIKRLNDERIEIIDSQYEHEYIGADGRQRNVYLEYIKKNYEGYFCLVLDADEVVSDNAYQIKDFLAKTEHDCFNPHMRHLIRTLGYEDSTLPKHYVPCRLFKVQQGLYYEEIEHNILRGIKNHGGNLDRITIWHMSAMYDIFRVYDKYKNNMKKSNTHSKDFLKGWAFAHIYGTYPVTLINPNDLPSPIKKRFAI